MSGIGYPKIKASAAKTSVFLTAVGSSGSLSTVRKLSRPTQVGGCDEVRVLQRHDHRARRSGTTRKPRRRTASAGGTAASSGRHRAPMSTGVRRRAAIRAPTSRPAHRHRLAVRFGRRHVDRTHTSLAGRSCSARAAGCPAARPGATAATCPALDRILRGAVRLLQQVEDVRVPVCQDGLHDGVQRVVDALRHALGAPEQASD